MVTSSLDLTRKMEVSGAVIATSAMVHLLTASMFMLVVTNSHMSLAAGDLDLHLNIIPLALTLDVVPTLITQETRHLQSLQQAHSQC